VDLLEVIASQAAVFIENAKLYQALEQRIDFANKELIATNRELLSEKSRIEAIVQGMADGVISVDLRKHVLHMNAAAERILGVRLSEAQGQPVGHCPFDDELRAVLQSRLPSGDEVSDTEVALTWPAPAVVRVQTAPVRSEGVTAGYVAVLTDITQFKQLDRMKTEFVSLASHELKSPLTAIKGFVALLERAAGDDAEDPKVQFLTIIDRQIDRMRRIIDDFLNIARLEAGRPLQMNWQIVSDVSSMVNDVVETERSADEIHRFDIDVPADLPSIEADHDKLYQVIANLVNNAVKYSPDGGVITVKAHVEDGEVVLSVSDEGIGIAADEVNQIFQRFRRVRAGGAERVTGAGLGLYLSRNIIEAHGGRIWVESRPGEGSTFAFAVPIRRPERPLAEES
jgi:PAS domain S-box-containing protein